MRRKHSIIILIIITLSSLVGCSDKKFDGIIRTNEKNFSLEDYNSKEGVKVFFFSNKDGITYRYIIYGTTNYSEYGTDIAASGISALAINTTNSIKSFTDAKINFSSKEINSKPYLECKLEHFNSKQGKDEAIVLIKSLKLGLSDIEKKYGSKYIQVIEVKDN